MTRPPLSALFAGSDTLLIQCAEHWLARGHAVAAVLTRSPEVADWAGGRGLRVERFDREAPARLAGLAFDWLFSAANLQVLPEALILQARAGSANFHDGPLPRHAGLNAPVWAMLEGETEHAITWHLIEPEVDAGDILVERRFPIAPEDSALTLNTRCFEAGIDGFAELAAAIEAGGPARRPQAAGARRLHRRDDRPAAAAHVDFAAGAAAVARLVRALDHGGYWNPLALPKIATPDGRILAVGRAEALPDPAAGIPPGAVPGQVLAADAAGLTVACGGTAGGAVRLGGLRDLAGAAVAPPEAAAPGAVLPALAPEAAARLTAAIAALAPGEAHWRAALRGFAPAGLPAARPPGLAPEDWRAVPAALPGGLSANRWTAALALCLSRAAADPAACDVALAMAGGPQAPRHLSGWVPLALALPADLPLGAARHLLSERLAAAMRWPGFARDLPLRDPALGAAPAVPAVGLSLGFAAGAGAALPGTALTLALAADGQARLWHDAARLPAGLAALIAARLAHLAGMLAGADPAALPEALPAMPAAEARLVAETWNATEAPFDPALTIPRAVAAQAARRPQAVALIHEDSRLSYGELDAAANRAAHVLRAMGVGPGVPVALCTRRTPRLVIGALAILKAGGAYVPVDPDYPADRIALYLQDSTAPVLVTETALAGTLPPHGAALLLLDDDPRLAAAPATEPDPAGGAGPQDLAYLIYTSGSTGRPKGVMVEHRNVAAFFAGMDARIPHDPPGTWLAVTSLSFDISVLELFWTLARGFRVVLMGDESRTLVSGGPVTSVRGMEFSLFYWGNDDGPGPAKYELLLEGARFADASGFCAVWTPERHFHAFGGPYPNPAVTGAAVAAVTKRLAVRAGSCVAPLHHPARIAEDWAVIDNLTGGRAGLAMASGWHPDDFVLRPENAPPANRDALLAAIDQVRRLWRGEAVAFPAAGGKMQPVTTLPRPVSAELPVWVTTAGNPETWKEAGRIGANVLTHLLGQSIAEVGEKIALYHAALREAGHDPARHKVTLMLHSYLAADRETARQVARGPMKDYLRAAAALIQQYAWAFPAFKRPQGVSRPIDIDLRSLSTEETEAILDFAFARYFEESGLFGTVEDALARVEDLKRIGVDEIACLIDYGIPRAQVLEGLRPLAEVLARANAGEGAAEGDHSIAAQILRHGVTHLQCTPSMARMILMNDEARRALGRLRQLMIGGEPLPGALAAELARAAPAAQVENMYGPTETTVWSTTAPAEPGAPVCPIGRPIANTRVHVLDAALQPLPVGAEGELWIGGAGVTRGYWQRPDLTAERYRPDPFDAGGTGRIYRTGDRARWRADGLLDFAGRADAQVKLRGYRIEPGEIEAAAEGFAGVRQAVALLREDSPGDPRLVLYVTGDSWLVPAALREALAARLPAHMVPAHVVVMPAFPLTPNRKIDRKALPAPAAAAAAAPETAYAAPAEGVQAVIARVWARVLGVPRVGLRDNFFALGGHSLLAVQAHRELRAELGTDRLSSTDILRHPTLAALAAHLGEGPGAAAAGPPAGPAAGPAAGTGAGTGADAGAAQAAARAEAMSKRRALRAGRGT
ncbi:MAG TPA: LLM class flavin-dependent oxidoreductase [Paracoccaceae bacterium]|nr:LLM class flavin-dependent oxidoreductase [Paracoccaceae bacterium]